MPTRHQLRAHKARAATALEAGKLEEAAAELTLACKLESRDFELRQQLAELLIKLGRKEDAIRELQKIAGHHALKGELLKAIAFSRTILDLDPQHAETQVALAKLYARSADGGAHARPLPASMVSSPGVARSALPAKPQSAHSNPLFSMLDEESFVSLMSTLKRRRMKAGEVIVREGAPGDSMFVVVEGMVNVVREEPSGEQRHLASLPEGSFFGEMALVAGTPRLATVIAAQNGLLFEIDRVVLTTLAAIHPEIDRVVHRFYQDRLLSNLLAASPLFRSFSFEDRRSIAARFALRSLEPRAPILEQDKPGLGFFVILRGQCEVSHVGADGTQHVYPPLREGDHFGEISLLFGTPCTATVRALTKVELLELPPGAFNELVRPNPIVKEMVDRIARERLLRTTTLQTKEESVSDSWVV